MSVRIRISAAFWVPDIELKLGTEPFRAAVTFGDSTLYQCSPRGGGSPLRHEALPRDTISADLVLYDALGHAKPSGGFCLIATRVLERLTD